MGFWVLMDEGMEVNDLRPGTRLDVGEGGKSFSLPESLHHNAGKEKMTVPCPCLLVPVPAPVTLAVSCLGFCL